MSKKLINLPQNCVDEMSDGLVRAHPGLCLHANNQVTPTKQVGIFHCCLSEIAFQYCHFKFLTLAEIGINTFSGLAKHFCFWEIIYSGPIRPIAITECRCVISTDVMVQLLLQI